MEQFHFDGTYDNRNKVVRDQHREVLLIEGRPYMRWVSHDKLTKRIANRRMYRDQLEQGSRLRVQLRGFKNAEINYAGRHLCKDLNSMDPRTLDKFRIPIYFEVVWQISTCKKF